MTTISARVKVADSVNGAIPNHLNQDMANFDNLITAVQSFNQLRTAPRYQKPVINPVR